MVPYDRNERFIAGGQKSNRITEKLAEQKLGHHRRLAVYGLGGVGYVLKPLVAPHPPSRTWAGSKGSC